MHLFRNMQEPESTDISTYPGYTKLSGDQQKKVAETYTNVFNDRQPRVGIKIAQGIAFETAKKMCEGYINEEPEKSYRYMTGDPKPLPPVAKTLSVTPKKSYRYMAGDPKNEGEAEEFQAKNDALVGMTEDEEGVISGANPEEDGAAKLLRLNHDKMCMGCGAIHPLDVVCFNGGQHSEGNKDDYRSHGFGGAGEILKQNHTAKGMNTDPGIAKTFSVEESDPLISAAAGYLSHRAKVSGLMEASGDIQKKNLEDKCVKCGITCKDGKCDNSDCIAYCGSDEPKKPSDDDDASKIMKKNHKDKDMKDKADGLDEAEGEASCPECGHNDLSYHSFDHGRDSDTGYHDAGGRYKCNKCGSEGDAEDAEPRKKKLKEEAEMWAENYYPAKPMEEHCGHCGHPKSFHEGTCATCNECENFVSESEVDEAEKKKHTMCFCGHKHGSHNHQGCKECKHEGVVSGNHAAHQFRKNDYKERYEDEYANIFAAQQGKINTEKANAALNWLPEELELSEGKGYEDIGPGDHVKFNHPLRGSDKVPQQGKGKVVMKGPAGWVLNTGGKHGTPGIVSADNYVSHRKAKKSVKEDEIIEGSRQKNANKELKKSKDVPTKDLSASTREVLRTSGNRHFGYPNEADQTYDNSRPAPTKAKSPLFVKQQQKAADKEVKESNDPWITAALGYIDHEVKRAGGPTDLEEKKIKFANAGSALRASSKSNPRSHPCPTCKEPNKLTPADKAKGYQCDDCANMEERGW